MSCRLRYTLFVAGRDCQCPSASRAFSSQAAYCYAALRRVMNTSGRCCVFQPFDEEAHDNLYKDAIAPAIEAAGLEPYRIDRGETAVISVNTLHKEIRSAVTCLADISTRNPTVKYELGYAIASGKDVVIISSASGKKRYSTSVGNGVCFRVCQRF